jgi:hypothetical protein
MRAIISTFVVIVEFALTAPAVAQAQSAPSTALGAGRYALVISGTSGGEEYAAQYRAWLDGITKVLREKGGLDSNHLVVLSEQPAAGEQKASAEVLKATLTSLASKVKSTDQLFIMLIGHGGGTGADTKFNLVGPDLTVAEWNALLKPIPGHLVFVDATGASYGYLTGLAGSGRVIISATNASAQQFDTVFAGGFVHAFETPEADADKNGRVSLWEAFVFASRDVAQSYEQRGVLATEHAVLDDTGKGAGRLANAPTGDDGDLAKMTYLDAPAQAHSADPAVQALIDQQTALTQRVDELLRARRMLPAADFDQQFEKLMIDLSMVSRDLRSKIEKR